MEIIMPKPFTIPTAILSQGDRRTKLRWWDSKENHMLDWSTVMQSAFNTGDSPLLYRVMSDPIRYVPMPCLGIEDETGKLFYEGDILEYGTYTPSGKKVSEPCRYVLICSSDTNQTVLKSLQAVMFQEFDIRKAKIVGNIYEQ